MLLLSDGSEPLAVLSSLVTGAFAIPTPQRSRRIQVQQRAGKSDKGATMVEYGLLVALIAMIVLAALFVLGPQISSLFTSVSSNL